jgi:hypothetical protein
MSTCRGPHDRLHVPHRASACFACSGGAKYPVQLGPGPQQRPSNRLRFRAKGNGAAPSGCRATPDPVRGHAQPGRTRFFVWPGSRVWSRCEFARSLPHSRARWEVADLVRCGVSGHCSELAGFEQIADYVRTAEGDQPRERESAMPDTLVLTDFVLIDGTGRAPAVGSSVFVEEGHIVAVGENRRRPFWRPSDRGSREVASPWALGHPHPPRLRRRRIRVGRGILGPAAKVELARVPAQRGHVGRQRRRRQGDHAGTVRRSGRLQALKDGRAGGTSPTRVSRHPLGRCGCKPRDAPTRSAYPWCWARTPATL